MNGIIIINKPIGFTSQDVVSKTKRILNEKKAGHTGTLDPMATGVLPVLLGEATKVSKYLIEHDKKYIATIQLGEKRDTGDSEGKIIEKIEAKIEDEKEIIEVLNSFLGKSVQIPPIYSAIKINGKKLYEYAREGIDIEIPPREIEIFDICLNEFNKENQTIKFSVKCSKGTYIRTLCEDISKKLRTVGYMKALERVQVEDFYIEDAITFEELEENKDDIEFIKNKLISVEKVFNNLKNIKLTKRKEELYLNGVRLTFELKDGIYNIYTQDNKYIGIGIVKDKLLKRDVVL